MFCAERALGIEESARLEQSPRIEDTYVLRAFAAASQQR